MPRTTLVLQMVCALAGVFVTIALLAAGHGWLIAVGIALWLALIWWGVRSRRKIAQHGLLTWPLRPTPRQQDAWALLLLVGVASLMLVIILAARFSWT